MLDIASGTGRYAGELLERECRVGLNDLSEKNMALTRRRLGHDSRILHTEVSNALDADIWERETWDAILLLGPIYHMSSRKNRLALLQRAAQHVKKGGHVFTAFMSRTAALLYGLKHNPAGIRNPSGAWQFWETGTDEAFVEATEWFVNAYFSLPGEIDPLVKEAGLVPLHLAGIEGVFGENMELFHRLDKELKKEWTDFILTHCEDIHMVHASKHLLSVARK